MPFRNDDSFPTALFFGILALLAVFYIWRDPEPPPRKQEPTALRQAIEQGDIATTPAPSDCDSLMVDPRRDAGLSAEQLKQKTIAHAKCLGIPVVDCSVTPDDPLCEGPPR